MILKLFGMFFLFVVLFFVVIVLCVAYRIRATLRSMLKNTDIQKEKPASTQTYTHHDSEGMVIDVEATKR